jgi:SAM-dependent methyltransferase
VRRRYSAWDEELAFWDGYLRTHASEAADPVQLRRVFPARLLEPLGEATKRLGRVPAVIELGSGPVSLLGWGVSEGLIDLTAVDPLADEYVRLARKRGLKYPVAPRRGRGEELDSLFPRDAFEIAYSSNAIDHAQDPRRCFEALTRVVAPGGAIYCEGFVREGTNAGWDGLHQHDLVPEDGHLVDYGRDGGRTDLTENLPLTLVHEQVETLAERGLTSHGYDWEEGADRDWRRDPWFTVVYRVTS